MRLFEVMTEARKVVSTRRFDKELPEFLKTDPSIGRTLAAFLRFRETALPQQGFNKKDYPFIGTGPLAGYRHVHLVYGRVILIYKITQSNLMLCAITDHKQIDGMVPIISGYIRSLGSSDFHPFAEPSTGDQPMTITPEQAKEAVAALYDFASHPEDRQMLALVAQGQDVPELWEMLRAMVGLDGGPEQDAMIVAAFGGPEGFQKKAAEILKQMA